MKSKESDSRILEHGLEAIRTDPQEEHLLFGNQRWRGPRTRMRRTGPLSACWKA